MPEKRTLERARADKKAGKAASTQAGEFIREQIEHIRAGRHGARSAKQAIAIGLSEARRSGVDLPPPKSAKTTAQTRAKAQRESARGHGSARARGAPRRSAASAKRARASEAALKRERTAAASSRALSRQARSAAAARSPAERSAAARKAARTRARM